MRISRILASVVCASMLVTSFVFLPFGKERVVAAEETEQYVTAVSDARKDEACDSTEGMPKSGDYRTQGIYPPPLEYKVLTPAILKKIEGCMSNLETDLDMWDYNLDYNSKWGDISEDLRRFANLHQEFYFYYQTRVYFRQGGEFDGRITRFEFVYFSDYSKEDYVQQVKKVNSIVNLALKEIKSGMSDYQKALVIHDWLANRVTYATERLANNSNTEEDFNCYGALVLKEGVCEAYAEAFQVIMTRAGLECYCVSNVNILHEWDVVKIDGEFYNLDVTWDDPDLPGAVNHYYFLLDNDTMLKRAELTRSTEHLPPENFDADLLTSKRFANSKWLNVRSMINYYGGKWYFAHYSSGTGKIYSSGDPATTLGTALYTFKNKWQSDAGSYWDGCYSRMQIYGTDLIFNTTSEILYLDLTDTSKAPETMYAASAIPGVNVSNFQLIYGLKVEGKNLIYSVNTEPSSSELRTLSNKLYKEPTPVPTPGKPTNVKAASASSTSIKISWSAVSGATGYQVWRSTSSTGTFTSLGNVTTTSKTSTGLTAGKTYYYKVRAYTEVNGSKIYGAYSSVVSAVPKLAQPANVKAASASTTSIKITWSAVSGATGYQVFRSTSSTGTFTSLGTVTTTSKTSTGLTAGKTYYYKVRAYKEVDGKKVYSDYSSVVNAIPKPSAPTGMKAAVTSANSVTVSWNAVTGATGYEVYRSESSSGTYSKLGTVTTTSRACPGLKSGKTYYFKVRAYKTVNGTKVYGNYSAVVSATPKA